MVMISIYSYVCLRQLLDLRVRVYTDLEALREIIWSTAKIVKQVDIFVCLILLSVVGLSTLPVLFFPST